MNIEIGGMRTIPGWLSFDNRTMDFNLITDELPVDDNSVSYIYMSHVIEHIPIACVENIFNKLYKKLLSGGKLRIVCPDLEVILKAYFEKNTSIFNNPAYQLGTVPQDHARLGIGGHVLSQFVTSFEDEGDTFLYTKKNDGKYVCSFSHISGWDYEMMHNLLKISGFKNIKRTGLEEIDTHQKLGQLCVNAYKE